MRELRFVQQAFEGSVLVLEADNGEQFVVPADSLRGGLVAEPAAAEAQPPAEPAAPEPQPAPAGRPAGAEPLPLAPRDIQLRVRAGESAESLAESSGMPLERVLRFALPILEERWRVTDEARRARARRPSGSATVVFAEAVDARFAAYGVDPSQVAWDSHRREDGQWVVTASWSRGEKRHHAEWTYTRAGRSMSPVDDAANDLLSDRPIPLPTPPRPAPPRLTLAPTPDVVTFPPMPEASTAPMPAVLAGPELFDQESPTPAAPAAEERPDPWQDVESPPLPLHLPAEQQTEDEPTPVPAPTPDPAPAAAAPARRPKRARSPRPAAEGPAPERAAARPAPAEVPRASRGSAARSPVPSWDDILMGVRRESE